MESAVFCPIIEDCRIAVQSFVVRWLNTLIVRIGNREMG
jgi:hypothetical protein